MPLLSFRSDPTRHSLPYNLLYSPSVFTPFAGLRSFFLLVEMRAMFPPPPLVIPAYHEKRLFNLFSSFFANSRPSQDWTLARRFSQTSETLFRATAALDPYGYCICLLFWFVGPFLSVPACAPFDFLRELQSPFPRDLAFRLLPVPPPELPPYVVNSRACFQSPSLSPSRS